MIDPQLKVALLELDNQIGQCRMLLRKLAEVVADTQGDPGNWEKTETEFYEHLSHADEASKGFAHRLAEL
jgi:hypothetical protein